MVVGSILLCLLFVPSVGEAFFCGDKVKEKEEDCDAGTGRFRYEEACRAAPVTAFDVFGNRSVGTKTSSWVGTLRDSGEGDADDDDGDTRDEWLLRSELWFPDRMRDQGWCGCMTGFSKGERRGVVSIFFFGRGDAPFIRRG